MKSHLHWPRQFYGEFKKEGFFATFFFLIKSSCVWVSPIIIAQLIDVSTGDSPDKTFLCLTLGAIQVGLILLNFPTALWSMSYLSRLTRGVSLKLRRRVCLLIHELSFLKLQELKGGQLYAKAIRDIELIEQLPKVFLNQILSTSVSCLIIVGTILWRAPEALVFFIFMIPTSILIRRYFSRKLRESSEDYRLSFEAMSQTLSNILSIIPVIRAHGLEQQAIDDIDKPMDRVYHRGRRFDHLSELLGAVSFVCFSVFQFVFLIACILMSHQGIMTLGDVVMFNAFFASLSGSLMGLISVVPVLSQIQDAASSLYEFLSIPTEKLELQEDVKRKVSGSLAFQNVSYTYPEADQPALDEICFDLADGGSVAIVGTSGSGKTTLLALILGFIKPEKGQILVGGEPLGQHNIRQFRRNIGVVTQEIHLFSGTIYENIAYGIECDQSLVIQALKDAEAWSFVANLPQGIETKIGPNSRLSGGQRQRLAIARAIVRNPALLILDEATSGLDSETESLLVEALRRLMVGRTTIVVSHRTPTITCCERVLQIRDGQLKDLGSGESYRLHSEWY